MDVDDIAFSCSLFSDKVDNRLKQLQMDAFGCMVQGWFLTYMYSVCRHSRRSSSSRNRTGKPYAAHLARLDYLLIYLPTQVQLTLTKIIKIVAIRWRILRLKCTKFDFGWGSAPDPAGGAYSALPDPLAGFGGPTSKERGREGGEGRKGEGRRGKGGRGGEERGREEREGEGRGRKGPWAPPLFEGSLRLW